MPPSSPKDLRPITARALQSVGDTLRPYLAGASVLDLYSGKGRLGCEALKEGADSIVFVEKHGRTAAEIRKLSPLQGPLSENKVRVHTGDALAFLEKNASNEPSFDIVFADPPFRLWNKKFGDLLLDQVRNVLRSEGILLVRYPKRVLVSLATDGWEELKRAQFGESELLYLVKL